MEKKQGNKKEFDKRIASKLLKISAVSMVIIGIITFFAIDRTIGSILFFVGIMDWGAAIFLSTWFKQ